MNKSGWLLIVAMASLCGVAATGASWWGGLTPEEQTLMVGRGLVFWVCCGNPLFFLVAGWQLNEFRRRGWRSPFGKSEEL